MRGPPRGRPGPLLAPVGRATYAPALSRSARGGPPPHGGENGVISPVRGRRERSERGGSLTHHLELQLSNTPVSQGGVSF